MHELLLLVGLSYLLAFRDFFRRRPRLCHGHPIFIKLDILKTTNQNSSHFFRYYVVSFKKNALGIARYLKLTVLTDLTPLTLVVNIF